MNVHSFIPGRNPELPEFYGMKISFLGRQDTLSLEVSEHRIIDKIYQPERDPNSKEIKYRLIGVAAVPLLEYKTKDDILGTITLGSIQHIEFDKNWSKVCAIREKTQDKKE